MGWENRPTCSKLLSLRQPSAGEGEERDTGYATCSSRRIGHEGPDVPPQCSLLSLINALGIALQHIPTSPCLCSQLNFKAWWSYVMWSRGSIYGYRMDASFSAPCSHLRQEIQLLLVSHIPGWDGDERWQTKRRGGRQQERHREKHISQWEELGSFLNFVDRRCCVRDRDRVRNATHQCRLAGRAGRCCLWRDALASTRCHMWSGLEKQNKTLFCQNQPCDIHHG